MSETDDKKEAQKILLAQARSLKLNVDRRWSVETLAEKVLEAQEAGSALEAESIREGSDTWVTLNKDAWPIADERHYAGETICVPKDMAMTWYKAGVAIPGEAPND